MALELTGTDSARKQADERPAWMQVEFRKKIGAEDRKFFTEQLALLLETGNSLVDSLALISSQATHPGLRHVVDDIRDHVEDGMLFSSALATHPELFPVTYSTLIRASEDGGYMDRVLKHMLMMEEKREELQSTLISAFTYPAFLGTFTIAVVIFILAYVFPKFESMFESIRGDLPPITVGLMWLSHIFTEYWWAVLGGAAILGAILWRWLRVMDAQQVITHLLTGIPVFRDLIYQIYMIQIMRVLSLSLENGVTLVEALIACKDLVKFSGYGKFIDSLHTNVNEGRGLSVGFVDSEYVPPLARQMVIIAEEAGRLPLVTGRIADYYQRELERKLKALSKVIEPVMLLVMGVVVGVIVSALILPIFKVSGSVH